MVHVAWQHWGDGDIPLHAVTPRSVVEPLGLAHLELEQELGVLEEQAFEAVRMDKSQAEKPGHRVPERGSSWSWSVSEPPHDSGLQGVLVHAPLRLGLLATLLRAGGGECRAEGRSGSHPREGPAPMCQGSL